MNILTLISGPLIGSVIGYGTNYIAVKMLFRPLKPKTIFGYTLPFTPGVIPKRKEQLAKAVGNAVGNSLLTKEDIETLFLSDIMKDTAVNEISNFILESITNKETLKDRITNHMEITDYEEMKGKIQTFLCDKIMDGLSKLDIGTMIAKEGSRAIKEKTQGTMLAMFVNDELISSIATPIGKKVADYLENNGKDMLTPVIGEEIHHIENRSLEEIMDQFDVKEERIKEIVSKIYLNFVHDNIGKVIDKFDISGMVETKINEMNVLEIEQLVLSVMKKELNTIVNLGALIGFFIGLLNLLF